MPLAKAIGTELARAALLSGLFHPSEGDVAEPALVPVVGDAVGLDTGNNNNDDDDDDDDDDDPDLDDFVAKKPAITQRTRKQGLKRAAADEEGQRGRGSTDTAASHSKKSATLDDVDLFDDEQDAVVQKENKVVEPAAASTKKRVWIETEVIAEIDLTAPTPLDFDIEIVAAEAKPQAKQPKNGCSKCRGKGCLQCDPVKKAAHSTSTKSGGNTEQSAPSSAKSSTKQAGKKGFFTIQKKH